MQASTVGLHQRLLRGLLPCAVLKTSSLLRQEGVGAIACILPALALSPWKHES